MLDHWHTAHTALRHGEVRIYRRLAVVDHFHLTYYFSFGSFSSANSSSFQNGSMLLQIHYSAQQQRTHN